MAERIGITMRVANAVGYDEPRDCLAQDWSYFMRRRAPDVAWLPIPNVGDAVVEFVHDWGLDGVILSGGNHVGSCPSRDATENRLLDFAIQEAVPVFAVCRGLHLLLQRAGVEPRDCDPALHVGRQHEIEFTPAARALGLPRVATVNSYHERCVLAGEALRDLEVLALGRDGCIEAVRHESANVFAVQWHPERRGGPSQISVDDVLLRRAFGWEVAACAV